MTVFYAYAALAFSAFTSATLLPGTSEAAFVLFVHRFSEHAYGALLCAGLANGLGSMVSYWMGRLLPSRKMPSEKTWTAFAYIELFIRQEADTLIAKRSGQFGGFSVFA